MIWKRDGTYKSDTEVILAKDVKTRHGRQHAESAACAKQSKIPNDQSRGPEGFEGLLSELRFPIAPVGAPSTVTIGVEPVATMQPENPRQERPGRESPGGGP